MTREWNQNTKKIVGLSDGTRSSAEIADVVGVSRRYVSKLQSRLSLPKLPEGARLGKHNHQFSSGRRVDLDGYVLVSAPMDHPYARNRANRSTKLIYEHRLVMEQNLGRYLLPGEVVDHIDGLTLHNAPENLRLFDSNGRHLAETIRGKQKLISPEGREKLRKPRRQIGNHSKVDSYCQRRKAGDVRLRQILLAALQLGADSPYLLGTNHHTKKAGIDLSDRSMTELALADLFAKWELGQTLL
jgi:hypothetical protein